MRVVGGLFEKVSELNRPFLDRCSETKYLAVSDLARATVEYKSLVRQFLGSRNATIEEDISCRRECDEVLSAVETGQLDSRLVESLATLRGAFLDNVLRPAVQKYLEGDDRSFSRVGPLYDSAVKLNGLIETVRFLRRVRTT
jgi:hypothetical protein